MRATRYLMPTLRDDPADAVAVSHRLLVRAGMTRQVGAGLWTWLPLGWRSLQRAVAIVREEMDRIGGQEMLMPVLLPAELWKQSGRYGIEELFKLNDRVGRDLVLAMTHEEVIALHAARELRSWRDLPQIWYHIQTKERDEPRPTGGVLRTREFAMKDSYTLDRDERRARRGLCPARGRLRAHLRPLRADVLEGRVRHRLHGRIRRARVHGAVVCGRGRGRVVRSLRLRRERREGA